MDKNTRTYWYDYIDIHQWLTQKSNNNIDYYVAEVASQDVLQATQRINDAFTKLRNDTLLPAAVIPINLGHTERGVYKGWHWTSLVLKRVGSGNSIQAFYNDSLGKPMDESVPQLRQIILNHGALSIVDFSTIQQSNGYDCGGWTLLNLNNLARTGELPEATEKDIIAQRKEIFGYISPSNSISATRFQTIGIVKESDENSKTVQKAKISTKELEVLGKEKEIEFISNYGGGNCGLYAIRDVLENLSNITKI